jgi:DNA-binding winged helix-turn-helix (wHTH) protein/tetratricopeptide (TPR) repeat protein
MDIEITRLYKFGPFRLDVKQQLLMHQGEPVQLAPKVFETLLLLVERRGQLVGKAEMMNILWPDRHVEESNLTQNIFTLRKLFRKDQGTKYIETVPRRGYRFVAPVEEIQDDSAPAAPGEPSPPQETGSAGEILPPLAEANISLAVLPVINESDDEELEYLADGLTEGIIYNLSRLSQLRVVARSVMFSYKGQNVNPIQVGNELGVGAVLVSSILLSGSNLSIKTELVNVANGWRLWGEQLDRPLADLQALESDLALRISGKLLSALTDLERSQVSKTYAPKPGAYKLYLKGRYYWNKKSAEGYRKAIESFQGAIEIDPNFAMAYSGLADSYVAFDFYGVLPTWETSPIAKAAALKALAIDDTLTEAHCSLACIKMMFERDWAGAEREFKRAIELSPSYAHAHIWYSNFLMAMGRIEESSVESQIARKLDPLDGEVNQYLGWHFMHVRQFDRAISSLEKTLERHPGFFLARVALGLAFLHRGEFARAIEELENASLVEKPPLLLAFLGHAYAMAGQKEKALKILEELKELSKQTHVPVYGIGLIYTALGNGSQAFEWFEKAYETQSAWLNWMKVTPEIDSLRPDPKFTNLLHRLNFPPDA